MTKTRFSFSWLINLVKSYKWWLVGVLLVVFVLVVVVYTIDNTSYNSLKIFSWKRNNPSILGKEVSLEVGQTLSIQSEKLDIKFLGVTSDSRCPEGVACFWAGQAVVSINVLKSGQNLGDFQLIDTNDGRVSSVLVDIYKISLLKLEPYPKSGEEPIDPKTYRITIKVDRTE